MTETRMEEAVGCVDERGCVAKCQLVEYPSTSNEEVYCKIIEIKAI